jgi:putative ABC transport system ATP-binding protein
MELHLHRSRSLSETLSGSTVAATAPADVIVVRHLIKTYTVGEIEVHALRDVSLSITRGDFVAIMGASGSGKSTLMIILGCLDSPSHGRYLLDGVDVGDMERDELADIRNRKIGFVFQAFNLIPRVSALANVELPLVYAGMGKQQRRSRAEKALRRVGLADRLNHVPSELSGGQQQRVAVARAIATNPAIVLADEPTGNLDTVATAEVMRILGQLNEEGRTVILITHEPEVAADAKRVIRLRDGVIVDDHRQQPAERWLDRVELVPAPNNQSVDAGVLA